MHGQEGPVQESNPGPLAPEARIMPLDQQASHKYDVSEKKKKKRHNECPGNASNSFFMSDKKRSLLNELWE